MNKLIGAFFQLDSTCKTWSDRNWQRCFEFFDKCRLQEVILQYARFRPENKTWEPDLLDEFEKCIAAAPKTTRFWLGLANDANLEVAENLNNTAIVQKLLRDNLSKTKELLIRMNSTRWLNRLLTEERLAGWYIPLEVANYTDSNANWVSRLYDYIQEVDVTCKKIANLPTIISPYFDLPNGNNGYVSPEHYAQRLAKFSNLVDRIYLQDTVGKHEIDCPYGISAVYPWIDAIFSAFQSRLDKLGLNHEAFLQRTVKNVTSLSVARWERFAQQLKLHEKAHVQRITFAFTDYFVGADASPTELGMKYHKALTQNEM